MEENEWAFCSLWARKKIIIKGAMALFNPVLKGDYFFNRAKIDNGKVSLDEVTHLFWDASLDCYLYFKSNYPQNLLVIDTLNVLKSKGRLQDRKGATVHKSVRTSVWVDVFCKAFSVPEWKNEVARIMTTNAKKLILLLAYDNHNSPVGCAALFPNNGVTGLYCLGTVPAQRRKGFASSIFQLARAITEVQGSLLFLQSFESENLIEWYKTLGFELVRTRKICIVPRVT